MLVLYIFKFLSLRECKKKKKKKACASTLESVCLLEFPLYSGARH